MSGALDPKRPDLVIGIVGAGVMGRGIAQLAAQAGIRVILYDSMSGAAAAARQALAGAFAKLAEKGKIPADEAQRASARIEEVAELAGLSPCHMIVEAIIENLEAKRAVFKQLESAVPESAILASNTSTLSITAIASACKRPERVAGLHFFNPVPLMKIVEVIDGSLTSPAVGDALVALVQRFGHRAVRAKDSPGFVVNHAGRGYGTESLRVLGEGIAEFWQIDRVLRGCAGFRMGPFELFDLVGLDVSHTVIESIYHQYYEEPRYRPSPLTGPRVIAGLYGRKTGRGFYRYENGQAAPVSEPAVPALGDQAKQTPVWVSRRGLGARLAPLVDKLGIRRDAGEKPGAGSLCLVAPLGADATLSALEQGLDPKRTVAVDCLFPLEKHRTLMTTTVTAPEMRDAAHAWLASDGAAATVIHDSPGFICQRVLAMIVNVAADMAQQRIALPADIDAAVTLGLGYPTGPLAWGDALGPDRILAILDGLLGFYGDPRYRASPWLKRRAKLGVSLLTAEA